MRFCYLRRWVRFGVQFVFDQFKNVVVQFIVCAFHHFFQQIQQQFFGLLVIKVLIDHS